MKVVVAGGTGYIGGALVPELAGAGHEVVVLTRGGTAAPAGARAVTWDGRSAGGAWAGELRGAGAVVNLAGANIGAGRWTEARKQELVQSRVETSGALVDAIGALEAPDRPKALVSASGIDYYGDRGDEVVTEESAPGDTFLAQLCVQWEAAARRAEAHGARVVLMRTSFVVGRGAPALDKLTLPFKLFAGGPIGTGRQWFPWIHLADTTGMYRWAIENERVSGPLNLTAPDVRRQRDFAAEVGRAMGRPSWAPAPGFALRLVLGQQAELILGGRRAAPRRPLELGYQFHFPRLPEALRDVLG
jgi:uncharacterized protein